MNINIPSIDTAKALGAAEVFMRNNGPTIAFAGGLVMIGTGTAVAVTKSLRRKYGEDKDMTVTEMHEYYKNVRGCYEYNKQETPEAADECNRAIRKTYLDEAKFYGKTYWLPAVLILGGTALTIGAYGTMGVKLATMTAAYNKLAMSSAVASVKYTEEVSKYEEPIDIPEGAFNVNPNYDIDPSVLVNMPYTYWFTKECFDGKSNPRWSNSIDSNMTIISCAFERMNQRFIGKGFMYLNEILDTFHMPLAPEGYQVGWIYSLTDNVQNQIDYYATPFLIEDGKASVFNGDIIPEGADVRIALSVVPDGSIDNCVYSRLFKTL